MRIETDRLIIRSLTAADEHAFIEMASDGSLNEIFGDCSECDKWMGKWIQESIQLETGNNPYHAYLAFAVEEKTSARVIGSVGTSYYEDLCRIGITYFIGSAFRGHGYMSEAVQAFVNYFFEHYNADTILGTAALSNNASCRTLENAGFTLLETKMYQDMFDTTAQLYNFYECKRRNQEI